MARNFNSKEEERLYNSWKIMRQNCNNPKSQDYKTYGGRGISYYKGWDSFDVYLAWALANGYALGKVLQRKDADGDFSPENCFFKDPKEISRNTEIRCNSFTVEYAGKVYTNESFARTVNINPRKTLRLLKAGKTAEEIVAARDPERDKYICYGHSDNSIFSTEETKPNQPDRRAKKLYTMNGVTASLATLCEKFGDGITRKEAQRRISRGWTVEDAILVPYVREKSDDT